MGWKRTSPTDSVSVRVSLLVEEKSFSAGRTLMTVGVVLGIVAVAGAIALGSSGGFAPNFGGSH